MPKTDPKDPRRTIHYKLRFSKDVEYNFPIELDGKTLDIIQEPKKSYPYWTKLECQKCENCPLDESKHEHCPIAANIVDLVDMFSKPLDFKTVELHIETPERNFHKQVDCQTAVRSLLGIYMVTSGCPVMDKLRPMVRYHLPLATTLETTYRSISSYLIAQYLRSLQGQEPDWDLKHLGAIYEAIETVNMHFRQRLQEDSQQNFALNALLSLDSLAYYINLSLSDDAFYSVESLFNEEFANDQGDLSAALADSEASGSEPAISYQYQFKSGDAGIKEFPIKIDQKTLMLINKPKDAPPAWTELDCHKCPNCPLDSNKVKHCPAAVGISETIEFFKKTVSIQEGDITVKAAERDYSIESATTTDGISSMMGLIMASSGCPILSQLRPLVRNHLPFATLEETVYRSLGMYLLSQYFLAKSDKAPDWKLKNFSKLYEEINVVNSAFCSRIREAKIEDASLNALVHLDCFAQHINFTISSGHIEDLRKLFKSYLE